MAVVWGELQEVNAPESTRHSKVEPGSEDEKLKAGVSSLVRPLGPESIVVCGAVVSTWKLTVGGLESMLRAASKARTSKTCAPSVSAGAV